MAQNVAERNHTIIYKDMATLNRKGKDLKWLKSSKEIKVKKRNKFYDSKAWRKLSKAIREATPLCEVSTHFDELRRTEVTDHIIPVEQGGAKLDERNLTAMSHHYHNRKRYVESTGQLLNLIPWTTNDDGDKIPFNKADVFVIFEGLEYEAIKMNTYYD